MGTIADKLSYLNETKTQFREKLNRLGADISDNATFRSYLVYLDNLYNGLFNLTDMSKNGVVGRTSQDTTTGKNLLGIPNQTITHNGVEITIENGTITLNGTATGTGTKNLTPIDTTYLSNDKYTLSLNKISGTITNDSERRSNFNVRNASTSSFIFNILLDENSSNYTFTSTTQIIFGIYVYSGIIYNNFKFKPQLELGSQATSYEPYTGGQPSPSPDYPQEIKDLSGDLTYSVIGKNLFDKNNLDTTNGFLNKTNGTITSNNAFRVSDYIDVSGFNKITISGNSGSNEDNCFYDENKNYISYFGTSTNSSVTASVPNNAKYLRVTVKATNLDIYQVEEGNQATTYEPYMSKRDFTISLKSKNLFDKNNVLDTDKNHRLNASGGYYTEQGYFISNMIKIEPSTTYTISYTPTAMTRICYYSTNTTTAFISKNDNQQTFTTPSNAQYLMFCNQTTLMDNIQLEKGNQATTYESYYDIHLDKIDTYKDKIYSKDNKFYLHKENNIFYFKNGQWSRYGEFQGHQLYYYDKLSDALKIDDMSYALSNYFVIVPQSQYNTMSDGQGRIRTSDGRLYINADKYSTFNAFQEFINNNNIYIIYALETPTTTEITSTLYPTLYNQLKEIQDYLIEYKSKYELILNYSEPNIEY